MEPFCIVMHLVFFRRWVFVLSALIIGLYASVTRRICTSWLLQAMSAWH